MGITAPLKIRLPVVMYMMMVLLLLSAVLMALQKT